LRVPHALDDWIFACDLLRGRRPDLEDRLDQLADALVTRARDVTLDEIVIVGHSMGATLAIEVVARALARDPALGWRGPAVCVLSVGSTIPKFTLHPAASAMRRSIAAVANAPAIAWAEYHARDDVISFYRFDPVTASRANILWHDCKPAIRLVQMHDMLEPSTFRRYRMKFLRLHYQFVMANERRAVYDHFMTVCGPIAFMDSVMALGGPADFFAPDGTLIDRLPRAPARPIAA
jgi:pimeloyl-ACP methyl ester carboxylesterase